MTEEISKLKTRLEELEKRETESYTKLCRIIIDINNRMNEVDLRVNTLLDQAENLLGIKEGQAGSESLDAKTVNLKTLVDAVNALRKDMLELREIVLAQ